MASVDMQDVNGPTPPDPGFNRALWIILALLVLAVAVMA